MIPVVLGSCRGTFRPIDGTAVDPQYLDVSVPSNTRNVIPIDVYRNAFAYAFSGSVTLKNSSATIGIQFEKEINGEKVFLRDRSGNSTLIQLDTCDEIVVETRDEAAHFLFFSGK